MPCRTDYDFDAPRQPERGELSHSQLEAALCGILTAMKLVFPNGVAMAFDMVDWKEAGVSRSDVAAWWKLRQLHDALRREEELREKTAQKLKASALSKLTPEERKALGL